MQFLSTLAFIIITITSMVNLIIREWRFNAIALGIQYLTAFVLVTLSWPVGMAIVKLIVGWMATTAIALTILRQHQKNYPATEPVASLLFRGLAGLLVILLIFVIAPRLQESIFPDIDLVIVQGGLMLLGMSLMQLGTSGDPYLNIISLLSLLTGFEVIHAALERSTLLTGMLAVVNLGLALVGVYFFSQSSTEEGSEEKTP